MSIDSGGITASYSDTSIGLTRIGLRQRRTPGQELHNPLRTSEFDLTPAHSEQATEEQAIDRQRLTIRERIQLGRAHVHAYTHLIEFEREAARSGHPSEEYMDTCKKIAQAGQLMLFGLMRHGIEGLGSEIGFWDRFYITEFASEVDKGIHKALYIPREAPESTYLEGAVFYIAQFVIAETLRATLGFQDGSLTTFINMPAVKEAIIQHPLFQSMIVQIKKHIQTIGYRIGKFSIQTFIQNRIRSGLLGILHDLGVKRISTDVVLSGMRHNLNLYVLELRSQGRRALEEGNESLQEARALARDIAQLSQSVNDGEIDETQIQDRMRKLWNRYDRLTSSASSSRILSSLQSSVLEGGRAIQPPATLSLLSQLIGVVDLMQVNPVITLIGTASNKTPSLTSMAIATIGGSVSIFTQHPLIGGFTTLTAMQLVPYTIEDATNLKQFPPLYKGCLRIQKVIQEALSHIATEMRHHGYSQKELDQIGVYALEALSGSLLLMLAPDLSVPVSVFASRHARNILIKVCADFGFAGTESTQLASQPLGVETVPYTLIMGMSHLVASSFSSHPAARLALNVLCMIATSTYVIKQVTHSNPYQRYITNPLLNNIPGWRISELGHQVIEDLKRIERTLVPRRLQSLSQWCARGAQAAQHTSIFASIYYMVKESRLDLMTRQASAHGLRGYAINTIMTMVRPHVPAFIGLVFAEAVAPRFPRIHGSLEGPIQNPRSFKDRVAPLNLAIITISVGTGLLTQQIFAHNPLAIAAVTAMTDATLRSRAVQETTRHITDQSIHHISQARDVIARQGRQTRDCTRRSKRLVVQFCQNAPRRLLEHTRSLAEQTAQTITNWITEFGDWF